MSQAKPMEKTRHPLAYAQVVAEKLIELLAPACERIAVAGSVRRLRPDVGDIELVAIPKVYPDFFANSHSMLDEAILSLVAKGVVDYRMNSRGARTFGPLNKLMIYQSGIWVDIFTATQENWGRDLLVRTGSADFNRRVMSRFIQLGKRGHAYGDVAVTLATGGSVRAPDEEAMFRLLHWDYIRPEERR